MCYNDGDSNDRMRITKFVTCVTSFVTHIASITRNITLSVQKELNIILRNKKGWTIMWKIINYLGQP